MFTVDRIEGDFVIVETDEGIFYELPLGLFKDVKEGEIYSLLLEEKETVERKDRITEKLNRLFK